MIETTRLILRPFREEDAADLYEYLKEPMVHCFACMKVNSLDEAKSAALERAKDKEYYFAILLPIFLLIWKASHPNMRIAICRN